MPWSWTAEELRVAVAVALALTFVAGGLLQGYRIDRFIGRRFPAVAARLPTDFGCWVGLVAGLASGAGVLF